MALTRVDLRAFRAFREQCRNMAFIHGVLGYLNKRSIGRSKEKKRLILISSEKEKEMLQISREIKAHYDAALVFYMR